MGNTFKNNQFYERLTVLNSCVLRIAMSVNFKDTKTKFFLDLQSIFYEFLNMFPFFGIDFNKVNPFGK